MPNTSPFSAYTASLPPPPNLRLTYWLFTHPCPRLHDVHDAYDSSCTEPVLKPKSTLCLQGRRLKIIPVLHLADVQQKLNGSIQRTKLTKPVFLTHFTCAS